MNYFFRQIDNSNIAEQAEAAKTNEHIVKILKEVDESQVPYADGDMWDCPFCHQHNEHPMRIVHEEDCIVLVARQVMHDADIETEQDRWEQQLVETGE